MRKGAETLEYWLEHEQANSRLVGRVLWSILPTYENALLAREN